MLLRIEGENESNVILFARVAAGGVSPVPLLLKRTGDFLKGKTLSEKILKTACSVAVEEISPISDVRGSKEYKRELLMAQIRAHLTRGVMK